MLHCALKLVSVKFSGLAFPRPTFSFGFAKSFFFSFLALADLPIIAGWEEENLCRIGIESFA
jgi:hypothetical protein